MCGVSGIFYIGEKKVELSVLQKFNRSIAHRGPDGEGYFISDDGNIGFGHRRLSIIDLSDGGKQPMTCCDNRFHITYNGEIFNFIELRKELEPDYPFRTSSDTEVILAAYRKWGLACLDKFNGMFAFAIWDSFKQELFMARDRFGIKPLYVLWVEKEMLAFASETIAFKYLEGYNRTINREHLGAVLQDTFALEGYGKTIFENIQQVPAGHYCIVKRDTAALKFEQWWNTLDHIGEVPDNINAQTAQFRELFFDACKIRLRSDVPIATALSGGLDSSSVYATIKHLANEGVSNGRLPDDWQTAFVATFPGAVNDERAFAEQVIKGVNGKAVYITPDEINIVDHIIDTTQLFDGVYLSPVSVAIDIYKAMKAKGYSVSMDGHGVDEMLLGYPHMVSNAFYAFKQQGADFLAEDLKVAYKDLFRPGFKPPELGEATEADKKDISFEGIKNKLKSYLPDSALNLYRTVKGNTPGKEAVPVADWLNVHSATVDENTYYKGYADLAEPDKAVFREFHLTTLPTILRNFDRVSMQTGVEIRMPFMDWRIVAYVFSLPFQAKVAEGYTKFILRNAMRGIVPEEIRLRKRKVGLNAPMPMWFSGALKTFIEDEVNSLSFANFDIWNAKVIREFVSKKSRNGWTPDDCNRFWPYLNAYIILNS